MGKNIYRISGIIILFPILTIIDILYCILYILQLLIRTINICINEIKTLIEDTIINLYEDK